MTAVLVVMMCAGAWGQSLGEMARKEKERRQKNRVQGVETRVIDEREVSTSSDAGLARNEMQEGEDSEESEESKGDAGEETLAPRSPGGPPAGRTPELGDRQQAESDWRGHAIQARQRIERAQKRYETLSGLVLVEGQYYVDDEGRPLITSLAQLRRLTTEAEEELQAATRAWDELREEARRAGVPPGWLR